jgi:hypothetical protein
MAEASPTTSLVDAIRTSTVVVQPGRYAYIKTNTIPQTPFFMVTQDHNEITVIAEEQHVSGIQELERTAWFKLLEINVSAPFIVAKGFLSKVTGVVGNKGLNIMIVSTYSKDYALVRDETWEIAVEALKAEGFPIEIKE